MNTRVPTYRHIISDLLIGRIVILYYSKFQNTRLLNIFRLTLLHLFTTIFSVGVLKIHNYAQSADTK